MRGENKRLCSSSNEVYRRLCPASQNFTQKVERKTHTKQQQQQQQVKRPLYTPLTASVILSLGYLQNQCNFLVYKIKIAYLLIIIFIVLSIIVIYTCL